MASQLGHWLTTDPYGKSYPFFLEVIEFFAGTAIISKPLRKIGTEVLEQSVRVAAKTGSKVFFEGAKYSQKVVRQMNKADDLFHGFPKSVDGYAAKYGQWSTKVGADGKTYQWLKMNGSYRGKTGTFEYIKDPNGVINHRFLNVH